jgi:hypothetical protein
MLRQTAKWKQKQRELEVEIMIMQSMTHVLSAFSKRVFASMRSPPRSARDCWLSPGMGRDDWSLG